jgi:hypothetical protein
MDAAIDMTIRRDMIDLLSWMINFKYIPILQTRIDLEQGCRQPLTVRTTRCWVTFARSFDIPLPWRAMKQRKIRVHCHAARFFFASCNGGAARNLWRGKTSA